MTLLCRVSTECFPKLHTICGFDQNLLFYKVPAQVNVKLRL